MSKYHQCPAMKRMVTRLATAEMESVFYIKKDGKWRASVEENDYTTQPILYCPYCGDKLDESKYNISAGEE